MRSPSPAHPRCYTRVTAHAPSFQPSTDAPHHRRTLTQREAGGATLQTHLPACRAQAAYYTHNRRAHREQHWAHLCFHGLVSSAEHTQYVCETTSDVPWPQQVCEECRGQHAPMLTSSALPHSSACRATRPRRPFMGGAATRACATGDKTGTRRGKSWPHGAPTTHAVDCATQRAVKLCVFVCMCVCVGAAAQDNKPPAAGKLRLTRPSPGGLRRAGHMRPAKPSA
jgi:hypothetical protein